ncbi:MAG: AAA family ATPase [Vicinamibacterales bacterium]
MIKRANGKDIAGLRFTSLRLENWRNFSSVEVELQSRVFLVGPNASGKSNLLDVFRFLGELTSVGGGLQAAVRRKPRLSLGSLRSLAARRRSDIVIHVRVGSDDAPATWEYELCLGETDKMPCVVREVVRHAGGVLLDRPTPDDLEDPEQLFQTHLEQVGNNAKFRTLAAFFESVRYMHLVPQLVREPDRSAGLTGDPFGGDFIEQVARTSIKEQRARLARVTAALQVAVPQLQELELWTDKAGTPHLRGRYEHWRAQGAWQNEDQLSDGTLRLLGLLWVMLDSHGPLLLEEPELSLHPEVVRYLPQVFARMQQRTGRQILLSTHSADLLRDEGIGLDEVLLLIPRKEGTEVRSARAIPEVATLLAHGSTLDETLLPLTRPRDASQLRLFAD